jgi:hypothetical protein
MKNNITKDDKDINSSVRLFVQKTRELNPPPNLTNRNRRITSSQESISQEDNKTQNAMLEKYKIISQAESSQLSKIPTKKQIRRASVTRILPISAAETPTINISEKTHNTKYDLGMHKEKERRQRRTEKHPLTPLPGSR